MTRVEFTAAEYEARREARPRAGPQPAPLGVSAGKTVTRQVNRLRFQKASDVRPLHPSTSSSRDLVEIFQLLREPDLKPRYNIAPTQSVAVIRQVDGHRELSMMRWGLVPSWSKDPKAGAPLINARAETVATKPAFRTAFKRRRCLIPADGFYEWQKTGGKTKQPFYIRMKKDHPFAFAGLWECWQGPDASALESCTIVTTEANNVSRPIHDRMPVILPDDSYDRWLDPRSEDPAALEELLRPYADDEMTAYPIATLVNSPRNGSPACIEPIPHDTVRPEG